MTSPSNPTRDATAATAVPMWRAWAFVALVLAIVAAALFSGLDRYVSLSTLVENHRDLTALVERNALVAISIYVALYVAFVSVSVPCSIVFSVAGGFLFGGLLGATVALLGATTGAIVIFTIARSTVGAALAARAGPRIARIGAGFRDGAWSYLLFLRLVPVFPFWLVNIAPAFFNVPMKVFAPATLLGMIPATATFAFAGAAFANMVEVKAARLDACRVAGREDCVVAFDPAMVFTPKMLLLFLALGCLALLPLAFKALRRRRAASTPRNEHL